LEADERAPQPTLRVGSHVLVQLGRELVTDPEQAILELVKNAYDADSEDCVILIDTSKAGQLKQSGTAGRLLRFHESTETVGVTFEQPGGALIKLEEMKLVAPDALVTRVLHYKGSITIRDQGVGLTKDAVRDSWLVVSNSVKRGKPGQPKEKTAKGRTPLGDKGLGRLGTMRLGDILRLKSAKTGSSKVNMAWFRWKDCDGAETLERIPVEVEEFQNTEGFSGTEVEILGVNDLAEWRNSERAAKIAYSIASIVSPFESVETFPVSVKIDEKSYGSEQITEDLLKQAVSIFDFKFEVDNSGDGALYSTAKFRPSIFTASSNPEAVERARRVLSDNRGERFFTWLQTYGRLKKYDSVDIDETGDFVIVCTDKTPFSKIVKGIKAQVANPGSFKSGWYYFNFSRRGGAAAGVGATSISLKRVGGITILRDGFRVRAGEDWLDLARSMTSGSTYHLRVDNTVGYFSLTGEKNFNLTEKSDREGFVDDAYYRGFEAIALRCKTFANKAQEDVRRGLDDYLRTLDREAANSGAMNPVGAVETVKSSATTVSSAAAAVAVLADTQRSAIATLGTATSEEAEKALVLARASLVAIEKVAEDLGKIGNLSAAGLIVEQEMGIRNEQVAALVESAAVGLAARGLTHELHTHLTEIERSSNLIKEILKRTEYELPVGRHLRVIDLARRSISGAAAQIDPLLPRTRALREKINLMEFLRHYFSVRASELERDGITATVDGDADVVISMNRNRLLQIVDNIALNSRYWLRDEDAPAPGQRAIRVMVDPRGFIISDNGPGVDRKVEDALFDLFVTDKPADGPGQGLGLYIVTQLLSLDGGSIELMPDRNEAGKRYRFSIDLSRLAVGRGGNT
jgi:signal transduction histidine kinase